ncbi:MAG: MarR family winged helix-turn-helix transcriptional regulator [Solirubrobacteraceae bacterium]
MSTPPYDVCIYTLTSYMTEEDLARAEQARLMCPCNKLRKGARGLTQLYENALAGSGLKITQLPVLIALAIGGDQPVTSLAAVVGLDRTTLTRNLRVLEQRGLVATRESDDDARVRIVSFTLEGSSVLSAALARWHVVQTEIERTFGQQRLQALYDELDALAEVAAV